MRLLVTPTVQLFLDVSAICSTPCDDGESCVPGNICVCLSYSISSGVCTPGRNINA